MWRCDDCKNMAWNTTEVLSLSFFLSHHNTNLPSYVKEIRIGKYFCLERERARARMFTVILHLQLFIHSFTALHCVTLFLFSFLFSLLPFIAGVSVFPVVVYLSSLFPKFHFWFILLCSALFFPLNLISHFFAHSFFVYFSFLGIIFHM